VQVFGGLEATADLDRMFRGDPDVEIVLISDQNYLLFTPLLPQIASSYTDPRHIVQAVREIRGKRSFQFRRDTVRAVDPANRRLTLNSGPFKYDALVLAPGARTDYFNIPGARENSWDYKSLQNAVELRDRIIDLCEHADHTADPQARRSMLTFVVVGGGYTGIELVTENARLSVSLCDASVSRNRGLGDSPARAGSGAGHSPGHRAEACRTRAQAAGRFRNRSPHLRASHASA